MPNLIEHLTSARSIFIAGRRPKGFEAQRCCNNGTQQEAFLIHDNSWIIYGNSRLPTKCKQISVISSKVSNFEESKKDTFEMGI